MYYNSVACQFGASCGYLVPKICFVFLWFFFLIKLYFLPTVYKCVEEQQKGDVLRGIIGRQGCVCDGLEVHMHVCP